MALKSLDQASYRLFDVPSPFQNTKRNRSGEFAKSEGNLKPRLMTTFPQFFVRSEQIRRLPRKLTWCPGPLVRNDFILRALLEIPYSVFP